MFLRTRLAMASLTVGLAMSGVVFAQQTQPNNSTTPAPNQQMRRMMMRRRAMRGMIRGFRQLNLTDQQRTQMRS
ncbi:MAG TPA: hypothetical protein VE863_21700, partial [Pyrinomonadaceae bacterium]|nr:hypothetical protein [Pyrinomonadaceae bacterium]